MPILTLSNEAVQTPQVAWVDAAGAVLLLTDPPNYGVLLGAQGLDMPPFTFVEEQVPLEPGARVRYVQTQARDIDLPVLIQALSLGSLRALRHSLIRALDPVRGDGRLRVTNTEGITRDLVCRYVDGLRGDERADVTGLTWQDLVLSCRAHDPYWYSLAPLVQVYTLGASAGAFLGNPFFPLRLSSSQVLAEITITNNGDVVAWPVWLINGPATAITLRNLTTDAELTLTTALLVTDTVTIDTRPLRKTVVGTSGNNLFSALSAASRLWPLEVGANLIRVEVAAATAASKATLSVYERFYSY